MNTTRIPASKPGDFLCEVCDGNRILKVVVTTSAREMCSLRKAGATVWVGRHGGWIRKD